MRIHLAIALLLSWVPLGGISASEQELKASQCHEQISQIEVDRLEVIEVEDDTGICRDRVAATKVSVSSLNRPSRRTALAIVPPSMSAQAANPWKVTIRGKARYESSFLERFESVLHDTEATQELVPCPPSGRPGLFLGFWRNGITYYNTYIHNDLAKSYVETLMSYDKYVHAAHRFVTSFLNFCDGTNHLDAVNERASGSTRFGGAEETRIYDNPFSANKYVYSENQYQQNELFSYSILNYLSLSGEDLALVRHIFDNLEEVMIDIGAPEIMVSGYNISESYPMLPNFELLLKRIAWIAWTMSSEMPPDAALAPHLSRSDWHKLVTYHKMPLVLPRHISELSARIHVDFYQNWSTGTEKIELSKDAVGDNYQEDRRSFGPFHTKASLFMNVGDNERCVYVEDDANGNFFNLTSLKNSGTKAVFLFVFPGELHSSARLRTDCQSRGGHYSSELEITVAGRERSGSTGSDEIVEGYFE